MKRLALLLLAFTGLMSACSKDDPVPQDGSLTPDSPEGREAVTIPDEFLRTYLLKYFDFDRNGELSHGVVVLRQTRRRCAFSEK